MSYIGNPIVSTDFPVDYKSGNGSTTAFTLSIAPASVNSIDVQISGVSQSPQTYSVSGTTLTFSAAPPTGTNNIVVRHLGIAGIPNVPAAGSVVPSSIGTGYSLWNLSGSDINYTAGNVGIGTASPTKKLDVAGDFKIGTGTAAIVTFNGSSYGQIVSAPALYYDANAHYFRTGDGNAERMRIDSSGNLLVGTTTLDGNAGVSIKPNAFSGAAQILFNRASTTALSYPLDFRNASTNVGGISYTNTATSFNTSSDYRLKENIAPMTEALNRVAKLKPVTYQWKVDGSAGEGFIAHELQAVVPDCVTGEKDAIDAEGKPVYQGIDTSFLVATLTAAIQELKAELDATKAEVAALKAGA